MPNNRNVTILDMPLVQAPVTKRFRIRGARSAVDIAIRVSPDQRVEYVECTWTTRPPAGIVALLEGQVILMRNREKTNKIRAFSDARFFAGQPRYHKHQLYQEIDFDFAGEILELVE